MNGMAWTRKAQRDAKRSKAGLGLNGANSGVARDGGHTWRRGWVFRRGVFDTHPGLP